MKKKRISFTNWYQDVRDVKDDDVDDTAGG